MIMKRNIAKIALCSLLAAAPLAAFTASAASVEAIQAEKVTVKGQVVDENGDPVTGAGVVVAGTANGTTADLDGYFTFEVEAYNPPSLELKKQGLIDLYNNGKYLLEKYKLYEK